MISGGISDKLGNRYEAKWLVRCLMDVIEGKATWLKYEGINPDFQGFEFAIGYGDKTEWHQTKMAASKGNWTIRALQNEGVLKAFSKRLSSDPNATCVLVSQDNAKDLLTLKDKARIANSLAEFSNALSNDQAKDFSELCSCCNCENSIAYQWLKRTDVRFIPASEIDSLIESYGDLYFVHGGKSLFPILRDILEKNFNKSVTKQIILAELQSQGDLKIKEWSLDPTILERLRKETDAYLESYSPFGISGELIPRVETQTLVEEIVNDAGAELILITGVAGSGKSGVIRGAIEPLRERDIPLLAFRVDHFLKSSTPEEIGKGLTNREESPVTTLKGTFPNRLSVLIIDQVDAISEVSGRNAKLREVLFGLIRDAHHFGAVKIVLVCRKFDLETDPRLRQLKDKGLQKEIEISLLDWNRDVQPLLIKKNVNVTILKEPCRRLLCLPVNLALFLKLDDPNLEVQTSFSLHEELLNQIQKRIPNIYQVSWSPIQALAAMCEWMTKRQILTAPRSVLDNFPRAVEILASEGLIIVSKQQLYFFHESFFDHVYARNFVNGDQSIVEMLTETEQYLFRRTQVRQILESLRQHDRLRYLNELSSVLHCSTIRFHIKVAICQWLGSIVDPTEQEFDILSTFDQSDSNRFTVLFRYAALSPNWFPLLYKSGWIQSRLETSGLQISGQTIFYLSNVAGEFPDEVAQLLWSYCSENCQRAQQILDSFGYFKRNQPDTALLELCERLIRFCPGYLFELDSDDRIASILHHWTDKYPERCGPIVKALLNAYFQFYPGKDLFSDRDYDKFFRHSLAEVVTKSPSAFIEGAMDTLLRVIDKVVDDDRNVTNAYPYMRRSYADITIGFDAFLALFRTALSKIVKEDCESAARCLDRLDPFKHETFMHLHLETIQAEPEYFAHRLPKLVSYSSIFEAGFVGVDWWSFAHACRKAFPFLDTHAKESIEQTILGHHPEIEEAILRLKEMKHPEKSESFLNKDDVMRCINHSGYTQWCIFETIGENLLGSKAISKYHELRRKFRKEQLPEPDAPVLASWAQSSIKSAQCEKMSHNNWLRAIGQYNVANGRGLHDNPFTGGARELANNILVQAKNNPNRFADLMLKIPETAPACYIEKILQGLLETETVCYDKLVQTIQRARLWSDSSIGIVIAQLIQKYPTIASNKEILHLAIDLALHGDPGDALLDEKYIEREIITIDDLSDRCGRLWIRGSNGTRGHMWLALASILWKVPEAKAFILQALEIGLEMEPLVSVRCCMISVMVPLFNIDKDVFSDSIRKLIILPNGSQHRCESSWLAPLVTPEGVRLFPYIFHQLPELASELVETLLDCDDLNTRLIGAWLIFVESFKNGCYIKKSEELAALDIEHKRLFVSVAADAFWRSGNRIRAETHLKNYFFDQDEQIRDLASRVFEAPDGHNSELLLELAKEFLGSPAFVRNVRDLLRILEKAAFDAFELVMGACERLLCEADNNVVPLSQLHGLPDLLKREYASSETSAANRKRILDIIDEMYSKEILRVDEVAKAHDRW